MNSLACIKVVPDLEMALEKDLRMLGETGEPNIGYVNKVVNSFDEYALEFALRLGECDVACMGGEEARKALASLLPFCGDVFRINETAKNNPRYVAKRLESFARGRDRYELFWFGYQAGAYDNAQVGFFFAEYMGLPCIGDVTSVAARDGILIVERETDFGREVMHVLPPVVLIVRNTQSVSLRIPTLKEKLAAKHKVIKDVEGIGGKVDDSPLKGELFFEKAERKCVLIRTDAEFEGFKRVLEDD